MDAAGPICHSKIRKEELSIHARYQTFLIHRWSYLSIQFAVVGALLLLYFCHYSSLPIVTLLRLW